MTARFFSFAHPDGVEWHDSAQQARDGAMVALQIERDDASFNGHWSDEVSAICWGEVREVSTEETHRPANADEDDDSSVYSEYKLQPIPPTPEQQAQRKLLEQLRAMLDRAALVHDDKGRSYLEIPKVSAVDLADLQQRLDEAIRRST